MTDGLYGLTLAVNALWFGSAFWYFGLRHETAAKLLVPRSARSSPIFATLSVAVQFLGGMNLALSLLSAMALAAWASGGSLFGDPFERVVILMGFGVAHASQLACNVPVAMRGGRIGESYWDVLSGPMLFIFVVDALTASLNFGCALLLGTA